MHTNQDNTKRLPPILQVGDVLFSPELFLEPFCCDYDACHGACCVEGDAGAPVTLDEVSSIESSLDTVRPYLSPKAQEIIDRRGVADIDPEGDLVTSIVEGRDCVFCHYDGPNCLCALETAHRERSSSFVKPISCSLYPLREKSFDNGLVGLTYHRWEICRPAIAKGRSLGLPLYRFLREPLIRRFGSEWYDELCEVARALGCDDDSKDHRP